MVKKHRMYVVKKYIRALSALDAIRQEKDMSVDECSLDINWRDVFLSEQMGFVEEFPELPEEE